eukprot:2741431-Pleurochrysis_carterae.AAC.2
MNLVDLHKKLRKGVSFLVDVWSTRLWVERHFSDGIGFLEVNVYKALTYFYAKEKGLMHGKFRARLAPGG